MGNGYKGEERRNHTEWHLNKSVSLSVIVLLVVNIATSAWWASGLTSDIEVLQDKPDLTERVIRLEAKAEEHSRILMKMNNTLDNIDRTIMNVSNELARRKPFADAVERGVYKK